jgi:hypothetical protein
MTPDSLWLHRDEALLRRRREKHGSGPTLIFDLFRVATYRWRCYAGKPEALCIRQRLPFPEGKFARLGPPAFCVYAVPPATVPGVGDTPDDFSHLPKNAPE